MKILFFHFHLLTLSTVFLFLNSVSIRGESIAEKVHHNLAPIAQILQEDPSGNTAQKALNNVFLPYDFQSYFYQVPGGLLEHSIERQKLVSHIEALLEPYKMSLINVSLASFESGNNNATSLKYLAYAQPDHAVKTALQTIVKEPNRMPDVTVLAYDTLFMLQLDDSEIRNGLVEFIRKHRHEKSKSGKVSASLYAASCRWGIPEMKELYIKDIHTPINASNYIHGKNRLALISAIRNAARGLDYFGKLSPEIVEALKIRSRELDLDSGDEREALIQFKKSISILNGERPPEFAVSWKGQLLGVSNESYRKWFGDDREIKSIQAFERSTPSKNKDTVSSIDPLTTPVEQLNHTHSPTSEVMKKIKLSRVLLIVPVTILVVGITLIALYFFRRKS